MPIPNRILWFVVLALLFTAKTSLADPQDDARSVAIDILQKLEQKKSNEVWDLHVSNWFKERMGKDAFLANMTVIQSQLGGKGTRRDLIQQSTADGSPKDGYSGNLYSFMFATKFPTIKVYEMIVMSREDNVYRLFGLQYTPNPN